MLIGRENEIKKLNELYDSGEAELVAIYGRRRVGKTYLVDETFEGRFSFRHAGLSPIDTRYSSSAKRKSRMKDQLAHFFRSLTLAGIEKGKAPETWLDAFYMLEDLLTQKDDGKDRLLLFFDEIQWLDTPRSGFLTAFEAFWNGWACHRHNLMVIVCGSSTSWILDKFIHDHGGLYGRTTCQIHLLPFSLKECRLFFEAKKLVMSQYDMVQAYMMVGGIPYYLKYFSREKSLPQNIDAMFFADDAPLKEEFDQMFASLFVNPETMKSIITALNTKSAGLSRKELLQKTGLEDSGTFSQYLRALISGNFIIRYRSFGNTKNEDLYKLTDPFCLFYLRFVKENRPEKAVSWVNMADSPAVMTWEGYAFENVCFNHIKQIKTALGISGVATSESLWSKRGTQDADGTQIDLLIIRRDHVINMCEIKFYSDEFSVNKDYHFTLVRRKNLLREHVPKKTAIHTTLITTYGLQQNEYAGDMIRTITMDDLFAV